MQQFPRYDSDRKRLKIKIKMNLYRNIDDLRKSLDFKKVPTHSSLSFSQISLKNYPFRSTGKRTIQITLSIKM